MVANEETKPCVTCIQIVVFLTLFYEIWFLGKIAISENDGRTTKLTPSLDLELSDYMGK